MHFVQVFLESVDCNDCFVDIDRLFHFCLRHEMRFGRHFEDQLNDEEEEEEEEGGLM